jgi:hypothetical protein
MRTTLDIADDVLAAARALAGERGTSIGHALSEIARRGLQDRPVATHGVPSFSVADDAAPITPEMVREANEDR